MTSADPYRPRKEDMTKLSCANCGQRYFGHWSPALICDYCHGPLEETGWATHGRRAGVMALPVEMLGTATDAGIEQPRSLFAEPLPRR
jgi:hypothetical protein